MRIQNIGRFYFKICSDGISILGMGISLYFKNHQANAQKNFSRDNFVKQDSTVADLIQYLQQADAEKSAQIKHLEKILQDNK